MTRKLTIHEQHAMAVRQRDHCLNGGQRDAHQHGEDILWLMGWADNAIEVQLIEAELAEGRQRIAQNALFERQK